MDDLFDVYIEDFRENLISLNEALLELENTTWDQDTINRLFRVAHTIKGNSAAVEFHNIEKVMHSIEDILYAVRNGTKKLTDAMVKLLYCCHDFLEDSIEVILENRNDVQVEITTIMLKIKALATQGDEESIPENLQQVMAQAAMETAATEIIESTERELKAFNKDIGIVCDDNEVWLVIHDNVLRGYSAYSIEITIEDTSIMKSVRAWMTMQRIDEHAFCVFSDPPRPTEELLKSGEFVLEGQSLVVIILTESKIDSLVEIIEQGTSVAKVDYALISQPYIENRIKQSNERPISIEMAAPIKKLEVVPEQLPAAPKDPLSTGKKETDNAKQDSNFIRIPAGKVDYLMDMLGELMIINSQLEQNASIIGKGDIPFLNNLSRMAKIIKNVQAVSMSLRMVEIKPTLHRLTRIIRDTAVELDKKINISIEGEEIEIDRSAAEKLFDPLMHLVRNAVSHGIESEEARILAGKKAQGTISIRAYNKRGDVHIEISDDGKGMDTQKVLAKAISLKMADEMLEYTEEQIIRFIFMAGFSTQVEINTISGRGVGMNVVESELKKLGGRIEIINRFGEGCTFKLRIPMNLAVLNGTIVQIASGRYIIPTLYIREFFIVEEKHKVSLQGHIGAVRVRESIIPILQLQDFFGIDLSHEMETSREYIILELEQRLVALPVSKILGRQEVVSKPLNEQLANSGLFSGASILGDGNVSMILDVEAIFNVMI